MNKVILMGRLVKDVDLRTTQTGKVCVRFTLAVNRRFSKEGTADFINCFAWEKTAEFIQRYFNKGAMLAIVGEIQTRTFDDDRGQRKYVTEVKVDEAYFTGEKRENAGYASQPFPNSGDYTQTFPNNDGFQDINYNEEDLPF